MFSVCWCKTRTFAVKPQGICEGIGDFASYDDGNDKQG